MALTGLDPLRVKVRVATDGATPANVVVVEGGTVVDVEVVEGTLEEELVVVAGVGLEPQAASTKAQPPIRSRLFLMGEDASPSIARFSITQPTPGPTAPIKPQTRGPA